MSSSSVLGELELEAKGYIHGKEVASFPFRSRGIAQRLFSRRLHHRSSWRQQPAGKPRKDESKNRQSTLVNQRRPEIAGAFGVDMVYALDINERSTLGRRNDDANAPCIVSEGAKDSSAEVD